MAIREEGTMMEKSPPEDQAAEAPGGAFFKLVIDEGGPAQCGWDTPSPEC